MQQLIEDYFIELVCLDSESKNERQIADKLSADLKSMGAEVWIDDAGASIGSNSGNVLARFPGTIDKPPILFCAHIDTVKPGYGIKPRKVGGYIESDGTTILGADDKSGVAQIIYGILKALSEGIPIAPIEVLFTVCEEIGLLGAKSFDMTKLRSTMGFAFDSKELNTLVTAAPTQNSLTVTFYGKEAHAGAEPEKGVNAIRIAAEAIAAMPMGRIDHETTCNIGIINGGIAGNIVPNRVEIRGEARSHNPQKLQQVCDDMVKAVKYAVDKHCLENFKATAEIDIRTEYTAFTIPEDHPLVTLAKSAIRKIGYEPVLRKGGGGSDANIFNAAGIPMVICGTGMDRCHTVEERIEIADLYKGADLVYELIATYSS